MPNQEEAITGGRDEIEGPFASVQTPISGTQRSLMAQWGQYDETERRILEKYKAEFSQKLQGEAGKQEPAVTQLNKELQRFWDKRYRYLEELSRYPYRSRRRRRHMRGVMHEISSHDIPAIQQRIDKALAGVRFAPPEWNPPETEASIPTAGLGGPQIRKLAGGGQQEQAITARAGLARPSAARYAGMYPGEETVFPGLQEYGTKIKAGIGGLRRQAGTEYDQMLQQRLDEFKQLRGELEEAVLATREDVDWPY